jgi:ubiquinone/menaquinone biosynthesis C-methylase UbiE
MGSATTDIISNKERLNQLERGMFADSFKGWRAKTPARMAPRIAERARSPGPALSGSAAAPDVLVSIWVPEARETALEFRRSAAHRSRMSAVRLRPLVNLVGLLALASSAACSRSAPPSSEPRTAPADAEAAHADHAPDAGHGKAGYHMDFSHTEHFAAHFDDADRDAWQKPKTVVALLALKAGDRVVDLGAGTGYFVPALSQAVGERGRVLAIDSERNMVEHVKRRAADSGLKNVDARLVQPDDPGLESDAWDRVLVVNTWHHIDDRVRYTQKLARALKPGGALVIVDFTRESDIGPPQHHRLSADEVTGELRAGGLSARILEEDLPKQYVVSGTRER